MSGWCIRRQRESADVPEFGYPHPETRVRHIIRGASWLETGTDKRQSQEADMTSTYVIDSDSDRATDQAPGATEIIDRPRERTAASTQVRAPWRHFVRHFAEMVVAMAVGMLVLGLALKPLLGMSDLFQRADMSALIMATNMTIGMSVWMRYRGHSRASTAEMGAAMYIPFAVLLIPFWAGLLPGNVIMMGGHVLMLPAMVAAMLHRRSEYLPGHAL